MSTAPDRRVVTVQEYLAGELASPVKHEYLNGFVYAMAGARNLHNKIATNILIALGKRLDGARCQPFNSDTKIRIQGRSQTRFYYPDVSVVCQENPSTDSFQDRPVMLVEVLSAKTRRIDEGEKCEHYRTIPTLGVYLMVEQDKHLVVALRRSNGDFVEELYAGLEGIVPLPEIGTELSLAEVYKGISPLPEPDE